MEHKPKSLFELILRQQNRSANCLLLKILRDTKKLKKLKRPKDDDGEAFGGVKR